MDLPLRLLIIVKQRNVQVFQEAWEEPQKIISKVLEHLEYDKLVSPNDKYDSSDCRFIAVERWDSDIFIVCDLFNVNYRHEDAHLHGKNELPVRVVRVSQSDQCYRIRAREAQEIKVLDSQIQSSHDSDGWEEGVPFKIDHANGLCPVYYNPRSLLRGP
ncbi:hypothetical protein HJFPF1_10358 [Paramyrothecium foliicola]|nr:hypothetical protein HJFPF1_10358 [Paramyrothecium foliicola]